MDADEVEMKRSVDKFHNEMRWEESSKALGLMQGLIENLLIKVTALEDRVKLLERRRPEDGHSEWESTPEVP